MSDIAAKADRLFLPFVIGDTYSINDVYGMVCFDAVFEGALEDANDHLTSASNLLLFRIAKPYSDDSAHYAGVTVRPHCGTKGVHLSLVAEHYGKTVDTIQRYNYSVQLPPKWVKIRSDE